MNTPYARPVCWNCEAVSAPKKVCSHCRRARYCSKACQLADWENHKQRCEEIAAGNQQRLEWHRRHHSLKGPHDTKTCPELCRVDDTLKSWVKEYGPWMIGPAIMALRQTGFPAYIFSTHFLRIDLRPGDNGTEGLEVDSLAMLPRSALPQSAVMRALLVAQEKERQRIIAEGGAGILLMLVCCGPFIEVVQYVLGSSLEGFGQTQSLPEGLAEFMSTMGSDPEEHTFDLKVIDFFIFLTYYIFVSNLLRAMLS